jgi:hypothetical protein
MKEQSLQQWANAQRRMTPAWLLQAAKTAKDIQLTDCSGGMWLLSIYIRTSLWAISEHWIQNPQRLADFCKEHKIEIHISGDLPRSKQ